MKYSPSTKGFYISEIHGDNMPTDVVDLSKEDHLLLLEAQSMGKIIVFDQDTQKPVAVDPPSPSENFLIMSNIRQLESTITPRRMREAVLGIDNGWLADINQQIQDLRAQLT